MSKLYLYIFYLIIFSCKFYNCIVITGVSNNLT